METQENNDFKRFEKWHYRESRLGKVLGGLVIVGVGLVFLAKQLGAVFPEWVFSWEMLLITIGVYIGARHTFRTRGWFFMVLVGGVFIIDDIFPGITLSQYILPILIIAIGLLMMVSPKKRCGPRHRWKKKWERGFEQFEQFEGQTSSDDVLDSVSIFGGVKKNIISKDFKGGEVTCIFGGSQINLSQADINGKVTLEVTQVFGGTKLIIPPHWRVQSEMVAIMGGIDDKRPAQADFNQTEKVLVIKGNTVFGGMEITSY